ncbi:biotin transporter BioY [Aphanothece sacrum]|uniref:Biotin transporter n=1 Tax=Aphanothece sacrum FPU1 TaxID=1920663 RepID=A0A401IFM2_APHSA|nr:biotin transporter BioY [Aphanothece sacrum]GBF80078.1 BioY protein [Aphanothece sacrum FPU1]GBF84622.1 BioY protein [Aphanothece sacrum FPU3]
MNTKRNRKNQKSLINPKKSASTVSFANEFLWAIIGLLLTVFSTFVEAFITNLPWFWSEQGINYHSLGVTFQVGAVLLTGCMGGKNAGLLSQFAYVFLGLFWLPVFAHGGGFNYWQEPSFGYVLGFIPGAGLCGWMAFRTRTKIESLGVSAIAGLLVIHICGLIYLVGMSYLNPNILSHNSLLEMIKNYSVNPLPGQFVIVCMVAFMAFILRQVLFY